MLEQLPASNFIRVHKSYIVALDHIDSIRKNKILIGEKSVPIGATFKEQFLEIINQ